MAKKDDNILTYVALAALGWFLYTRYAAPSPSTAGLTATAIATRDGLERTRRDFQTAQPDYLGPPARETASNGSKPAPVIYPFKEPGPPNPANGGYPSGYPRVYDE